MKIIFTNTFHLPFGDLRNNFRFNRLVINYLEISNNFIRYTKKSTIWLLRNKKLGYEKNIL